MKELKKIGQRVQKVMKNNNLGINELGRMTGTSGAQIHNIINGKNYGIVKLLNIINAFPHVSIEWLIRGKGEIEKKHLISNPNLNVLNIENGDMQDLREENARLKAKLHELTTELEFQKLIIEAHNRTISVQEGSIADLKHVIDLLKLLENKKEKRRTA